MMICCRSVVFTTAKESHRNFSSKHTCICTFKPVTTPSLHYSENNQRHTHQRTRKQHVQSCVARRQVHQGLARSSDAAKWAAFRDRYQSSRRAFSFEERGRQHRTMVVHAPMAAHQAGVLSHGCGMPPTIEGGPWRQCDVTELFVFVNTVRQALCIAAITSAGWWVLAHLRGSRSRPSYPDGTSPLVGLRQRMAMLINGIVDERAWARFCRLSVQYGAQQS
mmetsp:Transcript_18243/g.52027  ORF Transcript_18243/g.52027 Transcript_18243/m.52027 type:complete len:221 (+) Transcript_18243:289-951(+)